MFPRHKYYSITEVVKLYKITSEAYKKLLVDTKTPVVENTINLSEYSVNAKYVLKEDVDKLGLQKR